MFKVNQSRDLVVFDESVAPPKIFANCYGKIFEYTKSLSKNISAIKSTDFVFGFINFANKVFENIKQFENYDVIFIDLSKFESMNILQAYYCAKAIIRLTDIPVVICLINSPLPDREYADYYDEQKEIIPVEDVAKDKNITEIETTKWNNAYFKYQKILYPEVLKDLTDESPLPIKLIYKTMGFDYLKPDISIKKSTFSRAKLIKSKLITTSELKNYFINPNDKALKRKPNTKESNLNLDNKLQVWFLCNAQKDKQAKLKKKTLNTQLFKQDYANKTFELNNYFKSDPKMKILCSYKERATKAEKVYSFITKHGNADVLVMPPDLHSFSMQRHSPSSYWSIEAGNVGSNEISKIIKLVPSSDPIINQFFIPHHNNGRFMFKATVTEKQITQRILDTNQRDKILTLYRQAQFQNSFPKYIVNETRERISRINRFLKKNLNNIKLRRELANHVHRQKNYTLISVNSGIYLLNKNKEVLDIKPDKLKLIRQILKRSNKKIIWNIKTKQDATRKYLQSKFPGMFKFKQKSGEFSIELISIKAFHLVEVK